MDASRTVLPPGTRRRRPAQARRRTRLLLALAAHLAVTTFLAFDGVDRVAGTSPNPFDPSTYVFALVIGFPVVLALLGTLLPGRAPRVVALVLGIIGLVLALLLVPLYGLGLILLPGAAVGLWAGLVED